MNYFKKNERGVTLVELLLAMTLLTIVLITFMAVFTNAFNFNSRTSDKVKGVNFVKENQVILKDKTTPEGTGFYNFFTKIKDTDGPTTADLSRENFLYNDLKLIENITKVSETSEPALNDADTSSDYYFLLKLDNSSNNPYKLFVYVKETPDINNLYRLYIETYDKKENLLSKTYTYYEYN